MRSPEGWLEPGQRPEFDDVDARTRRHAERRARGRRLRRRPGQAVLVQAGERVRYSSPQAGGAHYVAVCLPAFSPATVNRDDA